MLSFFTLLADDLEDIIGKITPYGIESGIDEQGNLTGITSFLNAVLRIIFIAAGIFALINIILAGFGFIAASGDPKKVAAAWAKIWQSLLGLFILVVSFLIAAVIGMLLFKDPGAILNPKLIK